MQYAHNHHDTPMHFSGQLPFHGIIYQIKPPFILHAFMFPISKSTHLFTTNWGHYHHNSIFQLRSFHYLIHQLHIIPIFFSNKVISTLQSCLYIFCIHNNFLMSSTISFLPTLFSILFVYLSFYSQSSTFACLYISFLLYFCLSLFVCLSLISLRQFKLRTSPPWPGQVKDLWGN